MTKEEYKDYLWSAEWKKLGVKVKDIDRHQCAFCGGSCCYPIDDCENCPARPENGDPYWGMTSASIE